MKRIHILGAALLAVFAVAAVSVASASAVEFLLALWLVGGTEFTEELKVNATGELLLEDTKAVLGIKAMVLCSGVLMGLVGPNSLDRISNVLTLGTGTVNTTALSEPGLECTNQENCAEPLVWPVNLPWDTEVELMVDGTLTYFVILILASNGGGHPGWEVNCMGSNLTDECTAATPTEDPQGIAELTLGPNNALEASFSDAFTELAGLSLATCSLGGTATGVVDSAGKPGVMSLEEGGTLSASSDGIEA